jgi:hypothetical protein
MGENLAITNLLAFVSVIEAMYPSTRLIAEGSGLWPVYLAAGAFQCRDSSNKAASSSM